VFGRFLTRLPTLLAYGSNPPATHRTGRQNRLGTHTNDFLLGRPAPTPGRGQKCLPKDWDAKRELLKAKTGAAGTHVDTINRVLETYADAAHAAYHDAQLSGQRLPPPR
jgi:hypothetical protein